jgi:peptide/nickel transport system substrate-binding protein
MIGDLPPKVFLAGRVAVETDGVVIGEERFQGRQGRLFFAYLVAEQGRAVPRDELAEALWGEAPPPTWDKSLTVIASKLRNLLAEHGIDGADALTGAFGCYRLELPEGTWIDVVVAATAVQEAEQALAAGDLDEAKTAAVLAASLVRRPFLPGEEGTWVEEKRRGLADVRGRALSALTDAYLRSGDAPEAAKWAEQTIALEPFRETGYRRLMEAHVAAGNRGEALRVYEQCRTLLADELGTYPSPETESSYRALLEAPAPQAAAAAAAEPAIPDAAPLADLDRTPEPGFARRSARRRGVAVAVVVVAVTAAAVAGVLATRGGATHATAVAANAVGLIDTRSGQLSSQVPVGQAPTSVAVGEGAVWAANATAGTVSRIDPRTHSVQQPITVGASPSGIAVGGGGVWVANHDDNSVSWISPQSNTVVRAIPVGAGPTAVAYGYGSVWVTNQDDRTVTRIDADTGDVIKKAIRTNAVGRGIAVGGGSVWVTDEATRSVFGIDPATNTVASKATVGAGPTGIAYGDGSLWVANALDGTVSRVDATTLGGQGTIPVPDGPSAVSFSGGAVWVSAEFGSRVVRIDSRSGVVVGSTPIGNRPEGLATGVGGVWVAVQASGEGHRGGRLVTVGADYGAAPASIDPAWGLGLGVGGADPVYETLTSLREVGGAAGTQIVPNLAAALPQPTAGGTRYTFHLRPGIRYSDGRPLRAADFRRALARALELGLTENIIQPFGHLAGAAGCIAHQRCDLSRSVIVQGPATLTFQLPAPDPDFFYELMAIVPVPAGTPLHDVGTKAIAATGPYKIQSYVRSKLLTLVRNPYFHVWSAAARPDGYPDEIVHRTIKRQDAGFRNLLAGTADLLTASRQTPRFQDFATRHPLQMHLVPKQATEFVFLNVRRPPFDDIRVRRALNYAVDRKRVAALRGAAFAQPTCQIVPPTVSGYRPYCPYTAAPDASGDWKAPDLTRARGLIRASGTSGQAIVVWSPSDFRGESQYLVALLRRLGYRARMHSFPRWAAYEAALNKTPSAQAGFITWFGTSIAVDMLSTVGCDFQPNWMYFCDPRIDTRIARLGREEPTDPAGSAGRAAAIDREITNRAPWVPLITPRFADLTSARVGNYQASGGAVLLDQLWVR